MSESSPGSRPGGYHPHPPLTLPPAARQNASRPGTADASARSAGSRSARGGDKGGLGPEEKALKQIFAQKLQFDAQHRAEIEHYMRGTHETSAAPDTHSLTSPADSPKAAAIGADAVIDEFLEQVDVEATTDESPREAYRPTTAPATGRRSGATSAKRESTKRGSLVAMEDEVAVPTARSVGVRGVGHLSAELQDLKIKVATLVRERRKMQEIVDFKDEQIKRLKQDLEEVRRDPGLIHPGIKRLKKMGLNTATLSDLDERWAGYVFGRTSMAMEVSSASLRNLFSTHATNGVLTEESFKSVIRKFEPSIKSDQLTRLWYFADEDGSGKIDLFEFMRMIGCNSNGEMSEEYYEVTAMHIYRKFHARGGVRRVYATADKNWDQRLRPAEFCKFLKSSFTDIVMSKREVNQVFHRMNVSGTGQLTIAELETALEAAGAKCYVSETWVKETFQSLAIAVQDVGVNLKQLMPGPVIAVKDFKDMVLRFLPRLRQQQLDRLWKYLQASCSDDPVQVRHASNKERLPADTLMTTIFGPTLSSSGEELPATGAEGIENASYSQGGVGREVLEQLVHQLALRVGEVSPEQCFDALDPFITPEHFHALLHSRLGLNYESIKANQIFRLIDADRDGKITRFEFQHMLKTITPDLKRDNWETVEETVEQVNERSQVNRLQNRVHILERELLLHRGPASRSHAPEPMVPEKQFQQLSIAHGKVNASLNNLRSQYQVLGPRVTMATEDHASEASPRRHSAMPTVGERKKRMTVADGVPSPSAQALARVSFTGPAPKALAKVEQAQEEEQDGFSDVSMTDVDEAVSKEAAGNFKTQIQAALEENKMLRRRVAKLEAEKAELRGQISTEDHDDEDELHEGEPMPANEELCGTLHSIIWDYAQAMGSGLLQSQVKLTHLAQELSKDLKDIVIEGRWKCEKVLSSSARMVVILCRDLFLGTQAVAKLGCVPEAGRHLAHAVFVLRKLVALDLAPQVHYFSSPYCSLPMCIMDLMQGTTLHSIFETVQKQEAEPLSELQAAEISDALLRGMEKCHQSQVLNLSLRPDSIWVAEPMKGSRVCILDWGLAQCTSSGVQNAEFLVWEEERRKGGVAGKLVFLQSDTGAEVAPTDLMIGRNPGRSRALQNLSVRSHGNLNYMSLEQMYNLIRSFQKSEMPKEPERKWWEDTLGNVVKMEGHIVHWYQKGDGFVQTQTPVPMTPLGRYFEVEIQRVAQVGRRVGSDLGFCIGLTHRAPKAHRMTDMMSQTRGEKQECWFAGGDCAFYLNGDRFPVSHRLPSDAAEDAGAERRYLCVEQELRKGDRVLLLAEWNGDLCLFVNGKQVGYFAEAIDPCEVVLPLYGVADLFLKESTDEYVVRSISLVNDDEWGPTSWPVKVDEMEKADSELAKIHQILNSEASIATAIGPACDIYACGRIALQCFRGGKAARPSQTLERFAVALAVWATARCPPTKTQYDLLWALKEIKNEKNEKSEDLQEVANTDVRQILARCIKRNRYSRLGSCYEVAEMLGQSARWFDMSPEFLRSHEDAVEQAERHKMLDAHYSLAQQRLKEDHDNSRASAVERATLTIENATAKMTEGVRTLSAHWDLRPYSLSPSHITRIAQVLQSWSRRDILSAVSISRFEGSISDELQDMLLECFLNEIGSKDERNPKGSTPRATSGPHGSKNDTYRRSNLKLQLSGLEKKPSLYVEDFPLPADELPKTLSVEVLLERNLLWLAGIRIANLDLTPGTSGLGEAKHPCVGNVPGAVEILASAITRSEILTHLTLRSSCLEDFDASLLAAAVKDCPKLVFLDVSDNNIGARGVGKVMEASQQCITSLDLSRNNLGNSGAKSIADYLDGCHALSKLSLRRNGIGDEGGEALSGVLMQATTLLELDLADNKLSIQTVAGLQRGATASRKLRRLVFDGNLPWPSGDGHEAMVALFTDQFSGHLAVPTLDSLSLRQCQIRSAGAIKFFDAMCSNSSLRSLSFGWNGIRQTAARKIADALAFPSSGLEELDLGDNRLGIQDALAIALWQVFGPQEKKLPPEAANSGSKKPQNPHGLLGGDTAREVGSGGAQNVRLIKLNLSSNEITSSGAERIALVLPKFQGLKELYLYHNPLIGDQGAKAFSRLFNQGRFGMDKGVRLLNLAACQIGDAGCRSLMTELEHHNKVLRSLDLSCNIITRESAASVVKVISSSASALQTLVLSMNKISSEGILELAEGVAANLNGSLDEIDVSSQMPVYAGASEPGLLGQDVPCLSGAQGAKVMMKLIGLR